jgi:hypothetical protein
LAGSCHAQEEGADDELSIAPLASTVRARQFCDQRASEINRASIINIAIGG